MSSRIGITEEALRDMYADRLMSRESIADHFGCTVSNINRLLTKFKIYRGRAAVVSSWNKGLTKETHPSIKRFSEREITPETRRKISESRRDFVGENSPSWKGDLLSGRYRYLVRDGRKRLHHRLIAEDILGRPLDSEEHIHHVDHNGLNNDPSNLVMMSNSDHLRLHGSIDSLKWADQRAWLDANGVHYIHLGSIAA